MSELISREEVLKLPQRKGYAVNGWETYIRVSDVKELPAVQPKERCIANITLNEEDLERIVKEHVEEIKDSLTRKGKWIKIMKTNESETATFYTPTWICGDCKTEYDGAIANSIIKFCYNCGADMRGEQDE